MADAESTGNAAFIQAANDAKALSSKPSDNDLLTLYGLFKQGVVGDNNTEKVF
jgi:diazepam-binding inhibitor (GABA receptor modulating acyl-CoA-binding protein)